MRIDSSSLEILFDKEIFVPLHISNCDNWFLYRGWLLISSSETFFVLFALFLESPLAVVVVVAEADPWLAGG